MKDNNSNLEQLLKQWRDVEPGPDFEQNVLRRVRQLEREPISPWHRFMDVMTLHPAMVNVAATLAAIIVGAWIGHASLTPKKSSVGILAGGSIAGNYAQLITGDRL